jgi:hypothetical protein
MKKTGLLLLLLMTVTATFAVPSSRPRRSRPMRTVSFTRPSTCHSCVTRRPPQPTFTAPDFLTKERIPDANYVNGGLETPTSTKFEIGELVYLAGSGYQTGQLYSIVREMRDVNEYEIYPGQRKILAAAGRPTAKSAGCGWSIRAVTAPSPRWNSVAIPSTRVRCRAAFRGKTARHLPRPRPFRPLRAANGKLSGRVVLGKDFDGVLGTGMKLYMNMGSNQGVKVGDYFRVVRPYKPPCMILWTRSPLKPDFGRHAEESARLLKPIASLRTKGPNIHVSDLPRRAVGEVVVLNVTPTASSAMVVFALEDVYAGDTVELDEPQ